MCTEVFKELVLATDKWLWTVSNIMLYTTKELKSKVVFSLKQYSMCCYVVLSKVMEFLLFKVRFQNCFPKVCLCLLLFNTVSLTL